MSDFKVLQLDASYGQRIDEAALGKFELIYLTEAETAALVPGVNLWMVNSARNVVLGEKIVHNSRGGEGIIYQCSDGDCVIKLFHEDHRDTRKEKKLRAMTQLTNTDNGICWPKDVLTYNGKFVGFIMPKARGEQLNDVLFQSALDEEFTARMPKYDRHYQVELILRRLNLFKELHEKGVLVGDINTKNIMIDPNDANKVTLVDMDSVQFSVYNCPTTTLGYNSPEVILRNGRDSVLKRTDQGVFNFVDYYSRYYRTIENEYYAIAVLIYKILMLDVDPYTVSDHNDEAPTPGLEQEEEEIIFCADSVYPYSAVETEVSPTNVALYTVWSHFPSFLKEAFVNVFSGTCKRYTVDEWIAIFNRYNTLMKNGELEAVDPLYLEYAQVESIEFEKLEFMLASEVEISGFSLEQILGRIGEFFKANAINEKIKEIADGLKVAPVFEIGKYRFELLYNMGILKKVKCKIG